MILILSQNLNFMPEGSSCPAFCSASGPLLGLPAIFQYLTASLYLAFNSFARPFYPGTLNFDSFHVLNICLPFLCIAFDINVSKSVSLFASMTLSTSSIVPPVTHLAYYPTFDRIDVLIQHLSISNLCACFYVFL